jgi:hypothetical protein
MSLSQSQSQPQSQPEPKSDDEPADEQSERRRVDDEQVGDGCVARRTQPDTTTRPRTLAQLANANDNSNSNSNAAILQATARVLATAVGVLVLLTAIYASNGAFERPFVNTWCERVRGHCECAETLAEARACGSTLCFVQRASECFASGQLCTQTHLACGDTSHAFQQALYERENRMTFWPVMRHIATARVMCDGASDADKETRFASYLWLVLTGLVALELNVRRSVVHRRRLAERRARAPHRR